MVKAPCTAVGGGARLLTRGAGRIGPPDQGQRRNPQQMNSVTGRTAADATDAGKPRPALLVPALILALLGGMAWRLAVGWDRPFWFDETFTGTIAIQPDLAGLVRDCLIEIGGPVYYSLMWVWEKLAGAGDTALRVPSVAMSVAAPLLILWRGHPDRDTRMLWAGLAALSIPALAYAIDARPYSLLFLLGTVQAILFGRLLTAPGTGRAFAWAAVSMLLVLTHYHTLPLVGLQGLLYLALCRVDALRTWPAALAFAPAAIWMPLHLPSLFRFSKVAWQDQLSLRQALELPDALLQFGATSLLVVAVFAATVAYDLWRSASGRESFPYSRRDIAIFASSLLGVCAVFAVALHTRSFHARYLIPYIPGILFGLAIWGRRWSRRFPLVPALLLGLFLLFAALHFVDAMRNRNRDVRMQLAWQSAAEDFAGKGVGRMVFYWDHPTVSNGDPDLLGRAGGFFFRRRGLPVDVIPLILGGDRPDTDPNLAIRDALASAPPRPGKDSFIWMYWPDTGNVTDRYPARVDEWRQRFDCRNYGVSPTLVILGCIER